MPAITSINASTDSPSSAVGIINTNFANLNSDKIEASDVRTLTNKTISGDSNTISNLTTTTIKTSSKTGVASKLVTGTAGNTGEIAKWNSSGDLVTTSITISTSTPSSSSTDSTIPTSKAVYTAMSSIATNTQFFTHYHFTDGTSAQLNGYSYISLNSGQKVGYNFIMPSNYKNIVSIEVMMIPDTTETITWSEQLTYAAAGATHSTISQSDSSRTQAVTVNLMTSITTCNGANISTITGAIATNSIISFTFTSGTTLLRVLGIRVTFGV